MTANPVIEARLEARRIVRAGLRRAAPAAVAAVELEDELRAERARRFAMLTTRYGLAVLDPRAMVKVSVVA